MTDPVRRMTIAAVILNYNYARFLEEATASVMNQSDSFDELLVVDDGSTDDSLAVLQTLRIRVLSKDNGGQLSAALAGARAVTADFVYFLDADDIAAPQLVRTIRPRLADSVAKLQFPLRSVDRALQPTGSVFPSLVPEYDAGRMRRDNVLLGFYVCPPTSGNVYNRKLLVDLDPTCLDERDFIDGPVTMVMPYLGQVLSLTTPLASYRIHGANHSSWSRPDAAQLDHESTWFLSRWRQARTLHPVADVRPERSAYVTERRLMMAVMSGHRGSPRDLMSFAADTARSGQSSRQRVVLCAWAVGLVVLPRGVRRSAVAARRSPGDRPSWRRILRRVPRTGPAAP